jgi:hypothetical protein
VFPNFGNITGSPQRIGMFPQKELVREPVDYETPCLRASSLLQQVLFEFSKVATGFG